MNSTTEITTIYPSFVMHKHWETPDGFNERLYELAVKDALDNRPTNNSIENVIGQTDTHFSHLRHNFLLDYKEHDEIVTLTRMAEAAAKEYLQLVYNYDHKFGFQIMGDTFWQRRSHKENLGIYNHTHLSSDIVIVYYPKVDLDDDANIEEVGALRVYDPANVGKRFWDTNNKSYFIGGWFQVEPKTGSMVVLEGYVPHDSTYFAGNERMCIPMQLSLNTPKKHVKVNMEEIVGGQNEIHTTLPE